MNIYKEVILKDTTLDELNHQHQRFTTRLNIAQCEIDDSNQQITNDEVLLEQLAHDNQLPIKTSEVLHEIELLLGTVEDRLERYTRNISDTEEYIKTYEDKIARLQYQINGHTPNDITLNQDQLKSALASDSRIKEVQLHGYHDAYGELPKFRRLSLRMNGVVATLSRPDERTLDRLLAPTDTVYVPLPNLRVHIRRNNVSMLPIKGQGKQLYARGLTCHPHITSASEGTPCLGDFGGPIHESLDNQDFQTTIALTTLFLETIDPHDAAGSMYFPLIRKQINAWCDANNTSYADLYDKTNMPSLWITYPDGSCLPINFTPPLGKAAWDDIENSSDFYKHVVKQCNYYQQNPDKLKANNFIAPNQVIKLQGFKSDPTFNELFAECEQMQLEEPETA